MSSILIVEDHKIVAEVLANILRRNGQYEVAGVVHTAEAAMEKLSEQYIDLVLVDVSLPYTNGIELVAMIRREYPRIPSLMVSGHNTSLYVNRALEAGARGYIVKDDIHDIVKGIQHVLDGGTYLSNQLNKTKFNKP
ncbi:MAG TPA: response regulator transcription factor [Anaerolineales bacterium]|nr:response regulator transcription factor [Anaerolineales bacterium]